MIRIHNLMVVENEHLYGPGKRVLLFLKGCSLHCNGCINKYLWSFKGGRKISSDYIYDIVIKENAEGITLHGGEPLDQAENLIQLIKKIKENNRTVVLFTGYMKKELNKAQKNIWDKADLVIGGRFEINKINVNLQFRGSTNQRVYFHKGPYKNYKIQDGYTSTILTISESGVLDVNGFLTEDIKKLIDKD